MSFMMRFFFFSSTIFATLFVSTGASATNQELGMVSVPLNALCPTGQSPCCLYPDENPPCLPKIYNFTCYDPKTQTCCNANSDDCSDPIVLCNKTDFCAIPDYGCAYGGELKCCPLLDGYGGQCAGRYEVLCFDNRTETCCFSESPAVCKLSEVCCQTVEDDKSWCCPSGSQCGPNYNCVNHAQH